LYYFLYCLLGVPDGWEGSSLQKDQATAAIALFMMGKKGLDGFAYENNWATAAIAQFSQWSWFNGLERAYIPSGRLQPLPLKHCI
jgi:hypothetical protein